MPKLNGKTYAYTKKGKKKYKEALAKSNKKKLKKTLTKDFKDKDVYLPPKKGSDPKSLRDIGHMKSPTNDDQEEHGYVWEIGVHNTPDTKWARKLSKNYKKKIRLTKKGKLKREY